MILSLSYNIRRFLERLGVSEWSAFKIENKIHKFEDWLLRHPITILTITYDPIFDNQYHQYSISMDNVRFVKKTGVWRNTLIFTSKAEVSVN